ncbi:MAG: NYN domain-containing protein, partial [Coriobacteriia bacterium]|nr:NYN domain-containing protein [Coriobacteriia bacterium]
MMFRGARPLLRDAIVDGGTSHMPDEAHSLAVFIDFENLAIGVEQPKGGPRKPRSKVQTLDMRLVLERLVEKGKIVAKRAYADWARFQ